MPRNNPRIRAYLVAAKAAHEKLAARLAEMSDDDKNRFMVEVGEAVGAAVDAIWDMAHDEGHRCPQKEHTVPRDRHSR